MARASRSAAAAPARDLAQAFEAARESPPGSEMPKAKKAKAQGNNPYEQYHTAALLAWGEEHDDWPRGISSRAGALAALERAKPPKDAAQMRACWLRAYGSKGRAFPARSDPEDPAESEGEEGEPSERSEDDGEATDEPATIATPNKPFSPLRYDGPERASAFAASAASPGHGALEFRVCQSCSNHTGTAVPEMFTCDLCKRRGDLPPAAARALFEADNRYDTPAAAAAGTAYTAQQDPAELADKAFLAMARQGDRYPLYELVGRVDNGAAARILRTSYAATRYTPFTSAFNAFIQSGRLQKVQWALPRKAADQDQVIGIGGSGSAITIKASKCANMHELTCAIVSIVGALAQKPTAMFNWLALLLTATRLTEEKGWACASAYVETILQERVMERAHFGAYDPNVGNQAMQDFPRAASHSGAPRGAGGAQSSANHAVRRTGQGLSNGGAQDTTCHAFNSPDGCRRGTTCRFEHRCSTPGCKQPTAHGWSACPDKSKGRAPPTPSRGRGGRGSGASSGGAGGGPALGASGAAAAAAHPAPH